MNWMLMPLRRYADFSGRSSRKEYWMFTLFIFLVMMALLALGFVIGGGMGEGGTPGISLIMVVIFGLSIIVPSIAVQVRRFHDQDKSGWMVLLGFIPYVGSLIVLVFMCLEGTRGENKYGPDPKGAASLGEVFE